MKQIFQYVDEEKRNYIEAIVALEWDFFQQVVNEGGRASCQENPHTFHIMRMSQYHAMPVSLLEQILGFLRASKMDGHNVVAYKYAYMMAQTHPEGFQRIKSQLPEITTEKQELIEELVKVYMGYQEEIHQKFPQLDEHSRPLYSTQDTPQHTSIETYYRGEMMTYPVYLLKLYKEYLLKENPLYKEIQVMVKASL